jgi:hypothetical protein
MTTETLGIVEKRWAFLGHKYAACRIFSATTENQGQPALQPPVLDLEERWRLRSSAEFPASNRVKHTENRRMNHLTRKKHVIIASLAGMGIVDAKLLVVNPGRVPRYLFATLRMLSSSLQFLLLGIYSWREAFEVVVGP